MDNLLPAFRSAEVVRRTHEREAEGEEMMRKNYMQERQLTKIKCGVAREGNGMRVHFGLAERQERKVRWEEELMIMKKSCSDHENGLYHIQRGQALVPCGYGKLLYGSFAAAWEEQRLALSAGGSASQPIPFKYNLLNLNDSENKADGTSSSCSRFGVQVVNGVSPLVGGDAEVTVFQMDHMMAKSKNVDVVCVGRGESLLNNEITGVLTLVVHPRFSSPSTQAREWGPPVGSRVRSRNDKLKLLVEFRNQGTRTATVHWIDYSGGMEARQTLRPGESYFENTYASHPWLVVFGKERSHGSKNELLFVAADKHVGGTDSVVWSASQQTLSLMTHKSSAVSDPNIVIIMN